MARYKPTNTPFMNNYVTWKHICIINDMIHT